MKILILMILLIAFSVYPASADGWEINADIVSELVDAGGRSSLTTFYMNDTWYLISGNEDVSTYRGYQWNGTNWESYQAIVSGIAGVPYGLAAYPETFYMDDTWYLIVACDWGTATGYHWTGSTWQTDSSIVAGLGGYTLSNSPSPSVFCVDDTWYMISGKFDGTFNGWQWTGATWVSYPSIITGLPADIGSYSSPDVFYIGDDMYLISGKTLGTFTGFNWTGSAWQSDPSITSGLIDIGLHSLPELFQIGASYYLISGDDYGDFFGFDMFIPSHNVSGIVTNSFSSPIDGAIVTVNGNSNTTNAFGYYSIPGIINGDFPITAIATGYAPYSDDVTVFDSDTTKNFMMDIEIDYFDFDVNIINSQNTVLQLINGTFGDMVAGTTLEMTPSFNLTNSGNVIANVSATFLTSYNSIYGFNNSTNIIGGSNFSVQKDVDGTWSTLDNIETETLLTDTVTPDNIPHNWGVRLSIPAGQAEALYLGTVEFTFS